MSEGPSEVNRRQLLKAVGAGGLATGISSISETVSASTTRDGDSRVAKRELVIDAVSNEDVQNVMPEGKLQQLESATPQMIEGSELDFFKFTPESAHGSESDPSTEEDTIAIQEDEILAASARHVTDNEVPYTAVAYAFGGESALLAHFYFDRPTNGYKSYAQLYRIDDSDDLSYPTLSTINTSINGSPPKPLPDDPNESAISPADHDDDYPWPGDDCDTCHGCHGSPPGAPNGRYEDRICEGIDWECLSTSCVMCYSDCLYFGKHICGICIIVRCGIAALACCDRSDRKCIACATGTNPNCD